MRFRPPLLLSARSLPPRHLGAHASPRPLPTLAHLRHWTGAYARCAAAFIIRIGTHYFVLTTYYLLLTTYYLMLTTSYLLLGGYYLLLDGYYLLLGAYYLVLNSWSLILGA